MNHTPEPWHTHDHGAQELCVYSDDNQKCVAVFDGEGNWSWSDREQRLADARRIVACVNACAGVPLEWLESGLDGCVQGVREERDQYQSDNATIRAALKTQAEEAAKLMAQRDELIAAAKNLRDVKGRHHSEQAFNRLCDVVAAITKATKENP